MRNTFYYKSSRFAVKQFAVLLVVALISSYFSQISLASTFYYNAASSTDWSDVNNWWSDDVFTVPAGSLPTSIDDVVISEPVDFTSIEEAVVNSAIIYGDGHLNIPITVSTTVTFEDATTHDNTIVGRAVFLDTSSTIGSIIGTTEFYDSSIYSGGSVDGVLVFYDSSRLEAEHNGISVFRETSVLDAVGVVNGFAVFFDSSINEGTINASDQRASFYDTSTHNGAIVGDACFVGTAINSGTVSGETVECNPHVVSLRPEDEVTEVEADANLIIEFDTPVEINVGNIIIYDATEAEIFETISVDSEQVTSDINNEVITINPSSPFEAAKDYYVMIEEGAFTDVGGAEYVGIIDATTWNFSVDSVAPTLVSFSPIDNNPEVLISSNLTIVLDEEADSDAGNLTIYNAVDDSVFETIDTTSGQVTGEGTTTITINPTADFIPGASYYINLSNGGLTDMAGNPLAGIADETTWNFTADGTSPTIDSLTPLDEADGAPVIAPYDFEIEFNENVNVGTGNIYIYQTNGDILIETIDVTGGDISGGGTSTISVVTAVDLSATTRYYVKIDSTAFEDLSGNAFAGISDETTWNFITKAAYLWTRQNASGTEEWSDIASSSDGTKLAATVNGGYIHTSSDGGLTWVEQTLSGSRDWSSITSSADGVKLAATADSGFIYTSADGGLTWVEQTLSGSRGWSDITSSSDGVKLAATAEFDNIYTSWDSGVTWIERVTSGVAEWSGITSSADGITLRATITSFNNVVLPKISVDSGETWTNDSLNVVPRGAVDSSDDGTIHVIGTNGYVRVNDNAHDTSISGDWSGVSMSGTGSRIAVVAFNGGIFTSLDYGESFSQEGGVVAGDHDWTSIASSSDGTKLTATDQSGYIYTALLISNDDSEEEVVLGNSGSSSVRRACSDGLDNDGDRYVDFPNDPGCDSLGDRDEIDARTPVRSICSDGVDNDRDGYIDFPEDPGCDSGVDADERNSIIIPPQMFICSDGIDNDNDGLVDFPNDPGCLTVFDLTENNEVALIEGGGSSNSGGDTFVSPSSTSCNSNGSPCVVSPETCATNPSLCGEENTEEYNDSNMGNENDDSLSEGQGSIAPEVNKRPIIDFSDCPQGIFVLAKCLVTESFDHTGVVLGTTFKEIQAVLESETGNIITKSITTASLLFGALFTLIPLLFLNPLSFSEIFLLPMRIWSLLMTAFGLKKRNRQWGTVYDSVTKRPLDPVYVVLQDMEGKEIATSITDIDGRYGFLVKPGKYRVLPKKSDYVFPSLKMIGKTRDEIYLDLYFGYVFEVKKEGEVITKNIPMDPEGFNWNEYIKKEQKLTRFYSHRDIIFTRIADVVFSIGFTISTIALLVSPQPYNIAIFALYVLLLIFRELGIRQKKYGQIMKKGTDIPIGYSVLRIFDVRTGVEIMHKVSDQIGKYFCLIQNGTYYATIETKNIDETYTKIFTSGPIKVNHGILQENFQV